MSERKTLRYTDLAEPKKRASANQLGKAFARSTDLVYEHVTSKLNAPDVPSEERYVNSLLILGTDLLGAVFLEQLPRNVLGRAPRPDVAISDFWEDVDALKAALYDAFDKEVEARVAQALAERTPDDDQRQALEQLAAYDDLMRPIDVGDVPEVPKLSAQLPNCEIANLPEEIVMRKTPKPKQPKIHQVAKDLGINSKELIAILKDIGRDDLNHHMKTIDDPAIVAILPDIIADQHRQHPTVHEVAIKLNISTDELIADLQAIEHYDLNHPDAEILDPEIVDHVREIRAEREQTKAA